MVADWFDIPRPPPQPKPRIVRDAERAAIRANIQRLRGILDHMERDLLQEPLTEAQTQKFREAWERKYPSVRTARKWWEFWR